MQLFHRHLDAADLGLSALDQPTARVTAHLASCASCRRRADRVTRRLAATRAAAALEAEQALATVGLERQRQSVLARLARLNAGPRVIPFPGLARQAPPLVTGAGRHWGVVAAMAAGLLVGLVVGRLPSPDGPSPTDTASSARVATAAPADPVRDERLLSDVEEVLSQQVRPEFEALDGLTPIVYESR